MRIWQIILELAAAGFVGGVAAYLAPQGFRRRLKLSDGTKTAGWFQTALIGAAAAALAWGLRQPQTALQVFADAPETLIPTLSELITSLGIGLTGAKWFETRYQLSASQALGAQGTAGGAKPEAAVALGAGQLTAAKKLLA